MDLEGLLAGAGIYVLRLLWRLMPRATYKWRPFRPLLLMAMSPELRRTLDILQTDHHQHGKLGDVEEVWSAVRIVAKKLDQMGVPHPSVEAGDLAWRWWSFVTCLIPHAEAKDMDGARAAMTEMESIEDPFPYPGEKARLKPSATSDDERPQ